MLFSRKGSVALAASASLLLSPGVVVAEHRRVLLDTETTPMNEPPITSMGAAFCRDVPISNTAKVQQDEYINLWLNVGAYVCGDNTPIVFMVNETATGIAIAIAEAFAEVSTNCFAQGNAEVRAMGYALAEERAVALGAAVTNILAEAGICGQCTAAASALSVASEELISEAIVTAWYELYLFSDAGTEASDIPAVTSQVIVTTIATVLSEIIGILRAGVDGDCDIDTINTAREGSFASRCNVIVNIDAEQLTSTELISIVGAEAGAYACDGDIAPSEVIVIAQAAAEAVAKEISDVSGICGNRGLDGPLACSMTEAEVRAVVFVLAEAFPVALSEGVTCDCNVSVAAEVAVWDSIWASAAVNTYAETCSVGPGNAFDADFQRPFETRMLEATARALAVAVAIAGEEDGNECRNSSDFCTSTSPLCVDRNELCGGTALGTTLGTPFTLPCCGDDTACIVRNADRSFCRSTLLPIPSFWDGSVAMCGRPGLGAILADYT